MNEAQIEVAKTYIQNHPDQFVKDNAIALYPILTGFFDSLLKAGKIVEPDVLKKDVIKKRIVHAVDGTAITIETCDICSNERYRVSQTSDSE